MDKTCFTLSPVLTLLFLLNQIFVFSSGIYHSDNLMHSLYDRSVNIIDKNESQIMLICPSDIIITCKEDYRNTDITGIAEASGIYDTMQVAYYDVNVSINTCKEGFVIRRWHLPDASIFCDQRIDIIKEGEPFTKNNITWAEDYDGLCTELGEGETTFITSSCDVVTAEIIQRDTLMYVDASCLKIINQWRVIDWCVYESSNGETGFWDHEQMLRMVDMTWPELECKDSIYTLNDSLDIDEDSNVCEYKDLTLTKTALDDGGCGMDMLSWRAEVDLWADGYIDYQFSSYLPIFSPFYIKPTKSGEETVIVIPEDIYEDLSNHKIFWAVVDGCGNAASCTEYFVLQDKTPPELYCDRLYYDFEHYYESVVLWAIDLNNGSYDNCTSLDELRFTFSDTPPEDDPLYSEEMRSSYIEVTYANLQNNELRVYIWDEQANNDYCEIVKEITVYCPGELFEISGTAFTESGEKILGAEVILNSSFLTDPISRITNKHGNYEFSFFQVNDDINLSVTKNEDWLNGVSTLDLLLIQRHINGKKLDSPYKVIAADVKSDGVINQEDILDLRKLILHEITKLPDNDSWRFIDEKTQVITHPQINFTEQKRFEPLLHSMVGENFIGVKIGDVNESVIANFPSQKGETTRDKTLDFTITEKYMLENGLFELEVRSPDYTNVCGYQFTMEMGGLQFESIEAGALNIQPFNFVVKSENLITVSYDDIGGQTVRSGDILFTLNVKANKSGYLSNMISITSQLTPAEAYFGEVMEVTGIDLIIDKEVKDSYILYQNQPNPFCNETVIGFNMAESGEATITIYDVSRKVVKVIKDEYEAGYNIEKITHSDLDITGVLFYRLNAGTFTETKKMVIIE